jgi:type III pantothenate kinase
MILDIDVGNTRLKWRLSDGLVVLVAGSEAGHLQEMLVNLLLKIHDIKVTRVRLAHVLGLDREKEIVSFFFKKINIIPESVKSKDFCGAVVNKYQQPEQLGVDRWLAAVAAFNYAKGECCIIGCGTAITIDFVSDEGVYIGGYIAPGVRLLARALSENTKLLPYVETDTFEKLSYGKSTAEAIQYGTLMMAISFIERSIQTFVTRKNKVIPVYFSGGDAEMLVEHLILPATQINITPNLVLDGLPIALP